MLNEYGFVFAKPSTFRSICLPLCILQELNTFYGVFIKGKRREKASLPTLRKYKP
jgi:hypothetical protein